MKLKGKVAIVTGAGAGIGQAIAQRLAEDGADVVVAELRQDAAAATIELVQAQGRRALSLSVDVTVRDQTRRMVAQTVDAFGKVDILVNNAGGSSHYPRPGEAAIDPAASRLSTAEVPEEYWDYIIDLNLKGTFLCCQAVLGQMERQGGGRIINLASVLGRTGRPLTSGIAYSAAKSGVIGLTRFLATEVGPKGILVNAIAPGLVLSERVARLFVSNKEWTEQMLRDIPVGRACTPAEQAAVVAFLASDDAGYINGAVIDVNGGWFMG